MGTTDVTILLFGKRHWDPPEFGIVHLPAVTVVYERVIGVDITIIRPPIAAFAISPEDIRQVVAIYVCHLHEGVDLCAMMRRVSPEWKRHLPGSRGRFHPAAAG